MGTLVHNRSVRPLPIILAATCLLTAACSTGWRLDERRAEAIEDVRRGELEAAGRIIDQLYHSQIDGDAVAVDSKHGLLWLLERGLLALHADATADARFSLDLARTRAEDLLAADLAAGVASALANDTVRDYVGTAYERESAAYLVALTELIDAGRATGALPGAAADANRVTALDRHDRAINAMRDLCLVQTALTESHAGSRRYRGSGYFHLIAAATVLAHPQAADSDLDFADQMLTRAAARYRAERERYAGDRAFRYEVAAEPSLIERLRWRLVTRRSEHRQTELLRETDTSREALRDAGMLPPRDSGAVLVLEHRDVAARPQPLDVRLVATDFGSLGHRHQHDFRVGWMGFQVTGPGAWQVKDWGVLPMPGKLMGELAPGGLAVMGFSIPAHAPDHPIIPAPVVTGSATERAWDGSVPGEVVCDLDAWARAELKDRQVQVLLKTLTRAALKQIAAGQTAHEARRAGRDQHGSGTGDLIGLMVNLVASGLATASEQADIRAVTLLPDHVTATLIDLPPGTHHLRLRRGVDQRSIATVTVEAGGLVIVPLFDPRPAGLAVGGP